MAYNGQDIELENVNPAVIPSESDQEFLRRVWIEALAEMLGEITAVRREELLGRIPMRRFLAPEEVAAMASWLCGPECTFSTGAVFDLSGGRSTY